MTRGRIRRLDSLVNERLHKILKTAHTGQRRFDFVSDIFDHLIRMRNSRRHFVVAFALR